MGAQQSRSGSSPAPEGHLHKFGRSLKQHSNVDKLFRSSHSGANNSKANSNEETPVPSEGEAMTRGGNGDGAPATMSAALGGGTVASAAAPFLAPAFHQNASSMPPTTVPCAYRTGRTLGSGTYAIVKEAIHVQTGKYYACKVINKKLMEGREHMVRNEIAVLKRISSGHSNIVTLHDYFETAHNLYLCFDLCTGGELFDRICAKGNYYEADAADLVRTIFKSVKYIHDSGIVHRDLKPENLLFRTPAEDADIMIADFGLSRVMEEEKLTQLTEICGTPGVVIAAGHGKPVDVWAMGVITYFLLAGYTPFDRDSQQQEMEAIIAADYKFEPHEYWTNVSDTAKDFVSYCLTADPIERPTAAEVLEHKWLADEKPHFVPQADGAPADLLPHVKKAFNAKQAWRKAAFSITAVRRMTTLANQQGSNAQNLRAELNKYKEESEKEVMEDASITHHHNEEMDTKVADLPEQMEKTKIESERT
ncbi:Calcium/calmodulin-dependent protein kinase type I [Leucoagaricus sp. SymC.cos]|nr:Calcium/calmodulin-dependent protein kinase type I [Leucoagaricus sp. SymC.cos]